MKILIVYDSLYGNTEKIVRAIGEGISGDAIVLHANEATPDKLAGIDLLIVEAPTQGGRPSPPMQEFLKRVDDKTVNGMDAASFDTRSSAKWVGIFGYAAGKIAKDLTKKGGNLIVNPEPFYVKATRGPLKEGELERAADWAKEVIKFINEYETGRGTTDLWYLMKWRWQILRAKKANMVDTAYIINKEFAQIVEKAVEGFDASDKNIDKGMISNVQNDLEGCRRSCEEILESGGSLKF